MTPIPNIPGEGPIHVVVTGGRHHNDAGIVQLALHALNQRRPIAVLAEGGARGADAYAAGWADYHRATVARRTYRADWRQHGRAAGPIRNGEMLRAERPDVVVAFRGGLGTADCVKQARALGLLVWEVEP